jgi:hypothetical protein
MLIDFVFFLLKVGTIQAGGINFISLTVPSSMSISENQLIPYNVNQEFS